MRTIKFRAWDPLNKYFVFCEFNKIHTVIVSDLYLEGYVQQFTGLLDKNGKEIYEGDIVFDEDGEFSKTCKIEWNNESASFIGISIDDDGGFTMEEIDGEIIGNIYENPELLSLNLTEK
jgi:uncharacterized phage protein (TIGR01671 family)